MKVIDVSSYQPNTNFHTLKRYGIEGVFIKATQGTTYVNPLLQSQIFGARQAGLRVGFYHYGEPDKHNAKDEAKFFCSVIKQHGGIQRKDLRPALDLERNADHLEIYAHNFNHYVVADLGVGPLFYSFTAFIEEMQPRTPIGYGLWLANYGPNDGKRHPVEAPKPWSRVALHQYTSKGYIGSGYGPYDISYCSFLGKRRILANGIKGL